MGRLLRSMVRIKLLFVKLCRCFCCAGFFPLGISAFCVFQSLPRLHGLGSWSWKSALPSRSVASSGDCCPALVDWCHCLTVMHHKLILFSELAELPEVPIHIQRNICQHHILHDSIFVNCLGAGWRVTANRYCSVAKLCLAPRDPMDCSTPGFPVPQTVIEFLFWR